MRRDEESPFSISFASQISRRKLLLGGCSLVLPAMCSRQLLLAAGSETFIDDAHHTIKAWDGDRQVVLAYQQGETKGQPCVQLALAEVELPVRLAWQLPPEWVKRFPTIHFMKSDGQWELYEGWEGAEEFLHVYDDFNPPERSPHQISPFKQFVRNYYPPYWRWPGGITNHLLDPNGPHRFSEYELRGLKTSEKKRLHAAHHMGLIEPGRRPPSQEEIAAGLEAVDGFDLNH